MNKIDKLVFTIEENGMDAEDVVNLFLHYYGNQIITEDFFKFIEEEGYILAED